MSEAKLDLIVVQTIDRVELGQDFQTIPPHMTVLPWFKVDSDRLEDLKRGMSEIIKHAPAAVASATGGERAMYGPENDVPVCKMIHVDETLHIALQGLVRQLGGVFRDETYVTNWSPHVSDIGDATVQPGDIVTFKTVSVFSRQDDEGGKRKRVEIEYDL